MVLEDRFGELVVVRVGADCDQVVPDPVDDLRAERLFEEVGFFLSGLAADIDPLYLANPCARVYKCNLHITIL